MTEAGSRTYLDRFSPCVQKRAAEHVAFWEGRGGSLIFIPRGNPALYRTGDAAMYALADYSARFHEPALMYEGEAARAREMIDWPTDGIPTVRPNLGTVFIPGAAGQGYRVGDGSMPWPGDRLDREGVRATLQRDLTQAEMIQLARRFYEVAGSDDPAGEAEIVPYHADTQGVFDIAHLLYGEELFVEMGLGEEKEWIGELLSISLELYLRVSRTLKELLGEGTTEMVHGHATPQGLYFPHAGVRISEDTAILVSPAMIEEYIRPMITASVEPFGGGFVHYCGKHDYLFEMLCEHELVRAIDLGNPEMYDTRWLCERAARSGTVLYTRIASDPGEGWRDYLARLSGYVQETGARLVLRPTVYPEERSACSDMRELWHESTRV